MPWRPDYVTTAELRDYVRINDLLDEAQLALNISAASRAVDTRCNRQFGQVAVAEQRFYEASVNCRRGRWIVEIDDLMDQAGMSVTVDGQPLTEFTLEQLNASAEGRPWTSLVIDPAVSVRDPHVKITALWGWLSIPPAVKDATLLQASRFVSRRDSPFGIAGSPDSGSEMRLLARVDPDVWVMLADYVRQPRRVG